MKKLSIEEMKDRINKGFYIIYYTQEEEYELARDTNKKGYSSGVIISKERALEWINAGADLCNL